MMVNEETFYEIKNSDKKVIIWSYEANKIYSTNAYFLFLENEPINKHPNARSFSITTPPTTPIEINVDGSCCQASLVGL